MYETVSRKDALTAGLKYYFTGKECTNGHQSRRFVSTGACMRCNSERTKMFRKDAMKAQTSRYTGGFFYPLLEADHAAALAFCQALDMMRGRIPRQAPSVAPVQEITREQIREARLAAFGVADMPTSPVQGPDKMHPDMAAQLAQFLPMGKAT